MTDKHKLPIITIFIPDYCSNCRTPRNDNNFRFTLVGTEDRCAFLCNSCFIRLYAKTAGGGE